MCGLAGVIDRKKEILKEYETIDKMLIRQHHRGPDSRGVCGITRDRQLHHSRNARDIYAPLFGIMGFNRLSIRDLTNHGNQPMYSSNRRISLTFNGEIYNVSQLKSELMKKKKVVFQSTSDTEVILHLYEMYGFDKTIRMLNGMFAIVIYDLDRGTLYIARDRFGIIPLHIMIDERRIVWSSELKSFLELVEFVPRLNETSLYSCFKYAYSGNSLYQGVESVKPGSIIEWNECTDEIVKYAYFSLNNYSQDYIDKTRNYEAETETLLKDCLRRQLVSDVNLGVQFSGGIDSTLLAHYASEIFEANGTQLHGFSLINTSYSEHDEEKWIDYAASYNKILLRKIDIDVQTFIMGLEESLYAYERFINLPSPVGINEFAKAAHQDVSVLISGEGADEVCGGYQAFSNWKKESMMKSGHTIKGTAQFFREFDSQLSEESCKRLLPQYSVEEEVSRRSQYWRTLDGTEFDKERKIYFEFIMPALLERQNKVCMASTIENRVPFLDNKFVEYMFSIPEELLLYSKDGENYEGKNILKKISSKIYGETFAFRKKQAFRVPFSAYINHPMMQEYIERVILPGIVGRGILNVDEFQRRFHNMQTGEDYMAVLKAVSMELWCQFFIDGKKEFTF